MFKLIVFDLDGTLAPSKGQIDSEMSNLLEKLLEKYRVGIISGGDYPQYQKQLLPYLNLPEKLLKNLYICPTCSTKMYLYKNGEWVKKYSLDFKDSEKTYIIKVLNNAIYKLGLKPAQTYGELIEDRNTQITYSALGQEAPYEIKHIWDPDFAKRKKIKEFISSDLQNYSILLGGTSSVDITRKGVDKAFGIQKLIETTGIPLNEIIFVGDAIFPGGNDYPPLDIGVTCKRVFSVEDTKEYIRSLVN